MATAPEAAATNQAALQGGANAAARLPNLLGMSRADAHIAIRNQRFQYHGTTQGGMCATDTQMGLKSGSGPTGEVMRLGPRLPGQRHRPRYDYFGNPAAHPQGEFLPPLPGHGRTGPP